MLGVTLSGVVCSMTIFSHLVGYPCALQKLLRLTKAFNSFELVFVTCNWCVCWGCAFGLALLSVTIQSFQHCVLKILSFLGCFGFVVSSGLDKQALYH